MNAPQRIVCLTAEAADWLWRLGAWDSVVGVTKEWNEPLISGIAWVSELIERAGGEDIFAARRSQTRAPDRVVTSDQVIAADPEIIFSSWCGKPVSIESIAARPGWSSVSAVQGGRIYELAGAHILQPGFGLIRGYEEMKRHLQVAVNA